MANCFDDIRERSSSFDLHDISKGRDQHDGGHHNKPSLLAKLFRSISENSMRKKSPSTSPASSPKNSPKPGSNTTRRRRFVRVIKNDEQIGEEYVNPHVVRKYEKGFWETNYIKKSASLEEPRRPLPYTVSGPTILKKAHSVDSSDHQAASPSGTPPLSTKSCKFNEEVEIIEYDIKGKCLRIMNDAHVSHEKLHEPNLYCLDMELIQAPRSDQCPLRVTVEPNDISETNHKLEALEVIDENNALKAEEDLLEDRKLRDSVFVSDCSDTDSAIESCEECGSEKGSNDGNEKAEHCSGLEDAAAESSENSSSSWDETRCSNSPPPPSASLRQNSDEGISAPKKSKITTEESRAVAASKAEERSPSTGVVIVKQ